MRSHTWAIHSRSTLSGSVGFSRCPSPCSDQLFTAKNNRQYIRPPMLTAHQVSRKGPRTTADRKGGNETKATLPQLWQRTHWGFNSLQVMFDRNHDRAEIRSWTHGTDGGSNIRGSAQTSFNATGQCARAARLEVFRSARLAHGTFLL